MPRPPQKDETEKEFISRCISYLMKKEGVEQKEAAARCYALWREEHGGKKPSESTGYKIAKGA